MRIQKYIAHSGLCSRRQAEKLIEEKRVSVNGKVVAEQGMKIDPSRDKVFLDGKLIENSEDKVYLVLNKPANYISSTKDTRGRKTVSDLVKDIEARLVPVGRLDYETTGLLFMSNDGEFVDLMTHPRYEIEKTYHALVDGLLSDLDLKNFENGLRIEDYISKKSKIKFLRKFEDFFEYEIKIEEGRNRQVRKMFKALGYNVKNLERTAIESIRIEGLSLGEYRFLSKKELKHLKDIARKNFEARS